MGKALAVCISMALGGCHHSTVVRTAPVGEDVRIALATPATLTLVRQQGDTVMVSGVRTVAGRVVANRDDGVEMQVSSLADSAGHDIPSAAGGRVVVPNDARPRIERSGVSVWRTALAAFGFCIGLFALGIALGGGGP